MVRGWGLAAVGGGVAHVMTFHHVDHVFGNVGGMIGNALQILGHQDQLEGLKHNGESPIM